MSTIPHPAFLPVALISHFVLDALPHFGAGNHASKTFKYILFTDIFVASLLLLFVLLAQPESWQLVILGGVAAASPDLMWLGPWLRELAGKPKGNFGIFRRFHSSIQWCERSWGIVPEIIWFVGGVILLVKIM